MAVLLGLLAVVFVVAIVKGASWALQEQQAWQKRFFGAWHQGARSVGLETKQLTPSECRAQGTVEGVPLAAQLKLYASNNHNSYQSTVWSRNPGIPRSLSIQSDSALRSVARLVDGQDVPIGDPAFDALVELSTVDAYVCAALSYQA